MAGAPAPGIAGGEAVDPNMDPELAEAIRLSLEEEKKAFGTSNIPQESAPPAP